MKTKTDKRMNKKVKNFNKELKKDVFKNRFWVRQVCKQTVDGMQYYLYEVRDEVQPERNYIIREWLWGDSRFSMSRIWEEMNNFIVTSNFWDIYHAQREKEKNGIN